MNYDEPELFVKIYDDPAKMLLADLRKELHDTKAVSRRREIETFIIIIMLLIEQREAVSAIKSFIAKGAAGR